MKEIRLLKASEIECRVGMCKQNGCTLLLYKDARADMSILDETFGVLGWEREHQLVNGNLFCTVRVWDSQNNRWISKQDVGTESMSDKEKGQASDAFKRACVNFGIGRELYTKIFIWINLSGDEVDLYNKKYKLNPRVKFSVSEIEYSDDRKINHLIISKTVNGKTTVAFDLKGGYKQQNNPSSSKNNTSSSPKSLSEKQITRLYAIAYGKGFDRDAVKKHVNNKFNISVDKMSKTQYDTMCTGYENMESK